MYDKFYDEPPMIHWRRLFNSHNKEEFQEHYNRLNLPDDPWKKNKIQVIYPVLTADARNISRRVFPIIFGQKKTDRRIMDEIEHIHHSLQDGVRRLSECGIPDSSIKMGWIFSLDP